jgi:2-haloacid dehalogenase
MTPAADTRLSGPESAPTRVNAVVFDLGNVLITWDPHAAIARAVGQEQATRFMADPAFDFMAWNHLQDSGRPWDLGEDEATARHPHWEPAIRAYRANFGASLLGPIDDTVQILLELHAAGIPLYGLTNWSVELFPVARRRFPFLDLFEDIVISGEEGVAKPDPEIFRILRERVGHAFGSSVFVDDSPANIQAAAEAGLDAILFTDTGHLREDLLARGLPLSHA